MILMIRGDLLAFLLKNNKMSDQIKQCLFVQHTLQQNFDLRHGLGSFFFAINSFPRQKSLPVGGDCSSFSIKAVGGNQDFIEMKQGWSLKFVGLKLFEGA